MKSRAAGGGSLREQTLAALLFGLETHVDQVAAALGEDPLVFRQRQWTEGAAPDSAPCLETIALGTEVFGWTVPPPAAGEVHLRRARGVALAVAPPQPGSASAAVRIDPDGSFHLIVGPAGLGAEETVARVVSQALGVPAARVVVHVPDTDLATRDADGAHAVTSALAAEKAASLLEGVMRQAAARMLGVAPMSLVRAGGGFRASDGRTIGDADLAEAALKDGDTHLLEARATQAAPEQASVAAVFAEVEVDTETGFVRVLRLVSGADTGRVLDPKIAQARLESGLGRQAGADEVAAVFTAGNDPARPLGALMSAGAAAAVVNAVAQATGIRLESWPLTPEKVWEAIGNARTRSSRP